MNFIKTKIDGLVIFEPKIFKDDRGYFFESYNQNIFKENNIENNFVQDNQSYSKFGTIRGLHLQIGQYSQAKLVRVISGKVLDVAVDLRKNSKTFGQHVAVELSDENNRQFFIPRDFAHGFSVLSEEAIFAYKCDNFYNANAESGIIYNDKELNIDWKIPKDKEILNQKDLSLSNFNEYCKIC